MDNLFGKDDSGNDSDPVDADDKDDHFNSFDSKQSEPKDSSDVDMDISQVIKSEFDGTGAKSSPDQENAMDKAHADQRDREDMDIVKHESDIDGKDEMDHLDRDAIDDDVLGLPRSIPMGLKDRRESKEKSKRELEEEEREKMQVLVSNFTEDQLDRYEMYRRAAFPKAAIKRIMQTITGCSVSQNVVIAMSGIAKVFVGEIVEEALDVMETNEESGPLQPKHLREAVRRLRLQGQIPNGRAHKAFFRL